MSSTNEEKKAETTTHVKGGFVFGFEAALGWIAAVLLVFVVGPRLIAWFAEQRPIGPAYYQSSITNPNADNVPPGFYVIKR